MSTRAFIIGIAALFLATGTTHATTWVEVRAEKAIIKHCTSEWVNDSWWMDQDKADKKYEQCFNHKKKRKK